MRLDFVDHMLMLIIVFEHGFVMSVLFFGLLRLFLVKVRCISCFAFEFDPHCFDFVRSVSIFMIFWV